MSEYPIERRTFGNTEDRLSVLGFGGVIVSNTSTKTAARYVGEAVDRGINYFDVAPQYGNAQEILGPALKPYRDDCFLACKSRQRTGKEITEELDNSLKLLQTDHVDLYQLHSLQKVEEDVEVAFDSAGAMGAILKAQEQGKIRYIGFSAHTQEAAYAAMDQFDFDSILFPINYYSWNRGEFGPGVIERAREKGMAVLALKALALRPWTREEYKYMLRGWPKCWYKPLEEQAAIEAALSFTLGMGCDAAIPPGHWDLFELCLEAVEQGLLEEETPLDTSVLDALMPEDNPLFRAVS